MHVLPIREYISSYVSFHFLVLVPIIKISLIIIFSFFFCYSKSFVNVMVTLALRQVMVSVTLALR
jgi:hypothetical protein